MEDINTSVSTAISYGLTKLKYVDIKPDQKTIVEAYLYGKDALFCSPTGSGKSLTFEIAPFAFANLFQSHGTIKPLVIVVSPLSSLMKSQVQNLKEKSVNAIYLKDTKALTATGEFDPTIKNIIDLKTDIIFGSPETLLGQNRGLLKELSSKKMVRSIFVDEAHCIRKYGISSNKKKPAYRPHYGQLGEIRSLFGSEIPVVALTATASPEVKNVITKELCMIDFVEVSCSPNKPNITYWVLELQTGDICEHFQWLVNLLRESNLSHPRMIIFFRQIKHIAEVYEHLISSLGTSAYVNYKEKGPNDDRNRLFEMFHLKTDEEVKDNICSNYQNPDGNIRVVLSSTSFSMGLDVKGVDYVIHYGPANDIDEYVQETGRAGRDFTRKCHAILIKHKRCLNNQNISKEMKDYVKKNSCRRNSILQFFGFSTLETYPTHECCDVCLACCKCSCSCVGKHTCDSNTCKQSVPSIISAIMTTTNEHSNESTLCSSDSSDSDIELQSRRPQILYSSSDSDQN